MNKERERTEKFIAEALQRMGPMKADTGDLEARMAALEVHGLDRFLSVLRNSCETVSFCEEHEACSYIIACLNEADSGGKEFMRFGVFYIHIKSL